MDTPTSRPQPTDAGSCEQVEPLLAAAALGTLDLEDAALAARHLEECRRCRHLYADLHLAADALGWSVPQVSPPPALRQRLLSAMSPAPRLLRLPARAWAVAAAVLIIALLGGNLMLTLARPRQAATPAATPTPASAQVASLGPLAWYNLTAAGAGVGSGVGSETGSNAWGTLCAEAQGRFAWLMVDGLPQLPPGRVYQAWLQANGQRTSAGTFTVDAQGRAFVVIRLDQPIQTFQTVGVTDEPAGGSRWPTGRRHLFASL